MNKKKIGNLEVSAIGLGCMGLSHACGAPTEEKEAIRFLQIAADEGYTFFDTAEAYGFPADPHHNEKLLHSAFEEKREQIIIATKFGVAFDYPANPDMPPLILDSRPATIRRSVEGSLRRLGTDYIDLYYQHRIDPNVSPEEVAQVMSELIKEGKIRHWGISNVGEDYLRRAHEVCPVTAVENLYNMLDRSQEQLFPVLEELNVGLVAFCPMAKGLLSGTFRQGVRFERGDYRSLMVNDESIRRYQPILALLDEMGREKQSTPGQLSLAWMMNKRSYIVPIPGSRKESRLKENAGAADIVLTDEEIARIDKALDTLN